MEKSENVSYELKVENGRFKLKVENGKWKINGGLRSRTATLFVAARHFPYQGNHPHPICNAACSESTLGLPLRGAVAPKARLRGGGTGTNFIFL